jgi:hypothetical protein
MGKLVGKVLIPDAVDVANAILLGGDANLYRSAADVLKTDDALVVSTFEAIGQAAINANQRLTVNHALTDATAGQYGIRALLSHTQGAANAQGMYALVGEATILGSGGTTGIIVGLTGQLTYNNSGVGTNINGQQALVTQGALSGGISTARGSYYRIDNNHATNPIATALGLVVANNIGTGPITNNYGMQIGAMTATALAVGIDIGAVVGATTSYGLSVAEPGGAGTRRAINLPSTSGSPAGGITFGGDTTLYRTGTDTLATDDNFRSVGGTISVVVGVEPNPRVRMSKDAGGTDLGGLLLGPGGATAPDVNMYRSAANKLKTDDSLDVALDLTQRGQPVSNRAFAMAVA